MDGLRTARVMVLDDKLEEAKPFIEALAKRGIGSIYFSGDEEKLPTIDVGITGIRLAVIDLNLDVNGEAGEVIGKLITVLNRIIRKGNGPYLAIVWTTGCNDEYYEQFEKVQSSLKLPPIHLIKMKKGDYSTNDSVDSIFDKVAEEIQKVYPLGLLSFWEQKVHEATGSAMEVLPESADWITQSKKTLRLLLDAAANRRDTSAVKLGSLLSVLNSLQLDAIETAALPTSDSEIKGLIGPLVVGKSPKGEQDLKASLNYRLLCTKAVSDVAPGNVYHCDDVRIGKTQIPPSVDDLIADAADPDKSVSQQELKNAGCIPIAMEVTPLCDYQQRARGIPRFLCGLAVPIEKLHFLKQRAQYLRRTEAVAFDCPPLKGKKSLVWNSHYTLAVPKHLLTTGTGLVRLRQAPLIDVQAWLGSQGNRPGYLSIRVG